MCITDKQFGNIELFYGKKVQPPNTPGQQLELFLEIINPVIKRDLLH